MFGYVVINKPELKFKEFDIYHSFYCGLCQTLKEKYGYKGQVSLNYDLTFVALLLNGLYEPETKQEMSHCLLHPIHKYLKSFNECIDYAAQMTIVLTYYKCEDDWLDEKRVSRTIYKKWIEKCYLKIKDEYPDKIEKIENCLRQIHQYENQKMHNLDEISQYFGQVMGEICAYKDDEWRDDLYELGFYLGKFIYFMDAYDDIEDDIKKKRYNPFLDDYKRDDFDDYCYSILEMMISKSAEVFECLPIIENAPLMRNILYSGVWLKYEIKRNKKAEDKK